MSETTEARLVHLLTLEANWDGYGALPIQPETVAEVRRFLARFPDVPEPFVIPTNGGGVALEWQQSGIVCALASFSISATEWQHWRATMPDADIRRVEGGAGVTEQELAAIRERCERATPGPWTASSRDVSGRLDSNRSVGLGWEVEGPPEPDLRGQYACGEDAIFVATAREDVPRLVAEVERLRAALRDLVEPLELYHARLLRPASDRTNRGYCDCCCAVGDCDYRDAYEAAKAFLEEPA